MKLHGVAFALIFFVSLPNMASCFDAFAGFLIFDPIEKLANDPNAFTRASGFTVTDDEYYRNRRRLEGEAFSRANLAKGESIDLSGIDKLIEENGYTEEHYLQKAALMVAAGKSPAEIQRVQQEASDRLRGYTSADRDYLYSYIHSLSLAQSGLATNSPAWNRVHTELCSQVGHARTLPQSSLGPGGLGREDGRSVVVSQGFDSC